MNAPEIDDAAARVPKDEIGAEIGLNLRVAALGDSSWRVRRHAAELIAARHDNVEGVRRLIAVLQEGGALSTRNAAATALALLGPVAVGPLKELLGHMEAPLRKLAADILAERGDVAAAPDLQKCLSDPDANVVAAAAEALGRIGAVEAARSLFGLLSSPHVLVQVCALEALRTLKKAPPMKLLLPLLPARPAMRLLGFIDHPTAYVFLAKSLSVSATRESALLALGHLEHRWPESVREVLCAALRSHADLEPWLLRMLEHRDLEGRVGAIRAIGALKLESMIGHVASVPQIDLAAHELAWAFRQFGLPAAVRLLDGAEPPFLSLTEKARPAVAEWLIELSEPILVPHFTKLMRDGPTAIAQFAVRALGECRSSQAIAPLQEALEHDALASLAGEALLRLGASFPAEVVDALKKRPLTADVLRAWVQLDPNSAVDTLSKASQDNDGRMRAAACAAAWNLPADARNRLLLGAVANEEPAVRAAALRALAKSTEASDLASIRTALNDADPEVICAACEVVAVRRISSLYSELVPHLNSRSPQVVLAALPAVATLGNVDSAGVAAVFQHSETQILKAGLDWLATHPQCVHYALNLVSHSDPEVRIEAAYVLGLDGSAQAVAALRSAAMREPEPQTRAVMNEVLLKL